MNSRPDVLVLVTGTGTEVGKTWTCVELTRHFRRIGRAVALRKPAQSFEPGDISTDADKLAEATDDTAETVCLPHRWYPSAMAPPMAADALNLPAFNLRELSDELSWPSETDVGLVEGTGGVCSPLASDGDTIDFAMLIRPDVVLLVANSGLGTLNEVRLSSDALHPHQRVVFLNQFDESSDLHRRNREWLIEQDGLTVTTSITATVDCLLQKAVISVD